MPGVSGKRGTGPLSIARQSRVAGAGLGEIALKGKANPA
jgi:hypothetical protein